MSILDHNPSYESKMEYNDSSSTRLGNNGIFFWFSGHYINKNGVSEKSSQPYTENNVEPNDSCEIDDRLSNLPLKNTADNVPSEKFLDSVEVFSEEINRNIDLVNDLITELTGKSPLEDTLGDSTDVDKIDGNANCITQNGICDDPRTPISEIIENTQPVNINELESGNPEAERCFGLFKDEDYVNIQLNDISCEKDDSEEYVNIELRDHLPCYKDDKTIEEPIDNGRGRYFKLQVSRPAPKIPNAFSTMNQAKESEDECIIQELPENFSANALPIDIETVNDVNDSNNAVSDKNVDVSLKAVDYHDYEKNENNSVQKGAIDEVLSLENKTTDQKLDEGIFFKLENLDQCFDERLNGIEPGKNANKDEHHPVPDSSQYPRSMDFADGVFFQLHSADPKYDDTSENTIFNNSKEGKCIEEPHSGGVWFGFAGRGNVSMSNIPDMEAAVDRVVEDTMKGNLNDSLSTNGSDSLEPNSEETDQMISSGDLVTVSSLSCLESIPTLSDPKEIKANTGLLKLCETASIDDDVFVSDVENDSKPTTAFSFDEAEVRNLTPLRNEASVTAEIPAPVNAEERRDSVMRFSQPTLARKEQSVKLFYKYLPKESDEVESKPSKYSSDLEINVGSKPSAVEKRREEMVRSPDSVDLEFISSYLTPAGKKSESNLNLHLSDPAIDACSEIDDHAISKQDSVEATKDEPEDFVETSDDETYVPLNRGTSFRRSITIEDQVGEKRRQSAGSTCVSTFYFTPFDPNSKPDDVEPGNSVCQQAKDILNYLDNISFSDENFARDFEAIKKLHAIYWELKDDKCRSTAITESLSSVLNYMVVQEWPKIFVGVFKKLKDAYPHVFQEHDIDSIVYYSGHIPSILRMNRTSTEYAVAVIFHGLLVAAIDYTAVHEASRQASCEDDLISYLLEEIIPHLHNIHWGKATAKEIFLKSICDLIYNCARSPSNASYLIDIDLVNIFTMMRDEIFDIVDARKINVTMLLSLSYLIDDSNYDRIIPEEGSILRLLQFLDKSLEHSEHTYYDFTASELAGALSRIGAHYANKVLITRNSGQEILHKLLKHAYGNEEKIAACEALWNMAFSREAKDVLRGMGKLMNLLRELRDSDNLDLSNVASGIIWECEEKYDIKGTRIGEVSTPDHIMISYEYEAQPVAISIRDELEQQGYKVWMTSVADQLTLREIMTGGVEGASIVIVALTRKYTQDPRTFAEVNYSQSLRKIVIPLLIDIDFVPDGWLKEHIEKEKTFDFSRRSMFNGSLDALTEYLKTEIDGSQNTTVPLTTEGSGNRQTTDVFTWSNSDVIDWLKENRLIRTFSNTGRLQKLTGLHLLMFYDLKKESPDYYYSVLDSHLGFKDVLDTLEFTYALDRLLGKERLI